MGKKWIGSHAKDPAWIYRASRKKLEQREAIEHAQGRSWIERAQAIERSYQVAGTLQVALAVAVDIPSSVLPYSQYGILECLALQVVVGDGRRNVEAWRMQQARHLEWLVACSNLVFDWRRQVEPIDVTFQGGLGKHFHPDEIECKRFCKFRGLAGARQG